MAAVQPTRLKAVHVTDLTVPQHHITLRKGDVGRYGFLPGAPGRREPIARFFDEPRKVALNRECETWTGFLGGEKASVASTGIGGPSPAIAVEELAKIGADTFIRGGTSGSIQHDIPSGTLGVIQAAIRHEGTSLPGPTRSRDRSG